MVINQLSPFPRVLYNGKFGLFILTWNNTKFANIVILRNSIFLTAYFSHRLTMKHQCVCLEKEGSCHLTTFILEISLFTQLLNLSDPIEISPSAGSESSTELTEIFWPMETGCIPHPNYRCKTINHLNHTSTSWHVQNTKEEQHSQRRMPVLIKGFPQGRENKEQSSSGQTVFNTLLQCMVTSKQESFKDKVLKLVCFISRKYHHLESHVQSLSKSPSQVSCSVSQKGHRSPDRF